MANNSCANPALAVNDSGGWYSGGVGVRTAVSGFARPYAYRYAPASTATNVVFLPEWEIGAGVQITVSASVRCSEALSGSQIRSYVDYYDATDGSLGDSGALNFGTVAAGAIVRHSRTLTTPANCARIVLSFYTNLPSTSAYLDVTMCRFDIGTDSTYYDGDSAGWAWDGTAGLSTAHSVSVSPSGGSFFPFVLPPNGGADASGGGGTTVRDPLAQPFSTASIWNTPIGSSASYVAAGMGVPATAAEMPGTDPMRICLTPAETTTQIKYSSAGWTGSNRCSNTSSTVIATVPLPSSWVVPNSNKNECAAFLAADGRTVKQVQPLARCTAGTSGTAIIGFADEDLYGTGISGAQGGSKLSALGGTLRLGELRPGGQGPRHALKCVIDSAKYLYKATVYADTFRWPATVSDAGAVGDYGTDTNNTNTAMKMGSLLALHPSSTLPTTLRTEPGRQIAWTIQNFGMYIVDSTGADFLIPTEEGYHGSFTSQFASDYGFAYAQRANAGTNWVADIIDIVNALYVVNNNTASTIGGGGTPRVTPVVELIGP